jgi:hypothetical protein
MPDTFLTFGYLCGCTAIFKFTASSSQIIKQEESSRRAEDAVSKSNDRSFNFPFTGDNCPVASHWYVVLYS